MKIMQKTRVQAKFKIYTSAKENVEKNKKLSSNPKEVGGDGGMQDGGA